MTTAMTKTMTVVLKARRPHSFETTSFRPGSTFCDQVKLDLCFVILVCLFVSNSWRPDGISKLFSSFSSLVRLSISSCSAARSCTGFKTRGWNARVGTKQTWLVWNMSPSFCPYGIYSSLKRKKCISWSIWGKYVIRTHLNMVKKWIRKLNTAPLYLHG